MLGEVSRGLAASSILTGAFSSTTRPACAHMTAATEREVPALVLDDQRSTAANEVVELGLRQRPAPAAWNRRGCR